MATGARLGTAALAGALLMLTGCVSAPPGPLDDCYTGILFQDNTFRQNNQVRRSAPTEAAGLGTGGVVGCDKKPVDHVAVHKIKGVDPDIAIAVVDTRWHGVYVREGTKPSDWPSTIRRSLGAQSTHAPVETGAVADAAFAMTGRLSSSVST